MNISNNQITITLINSFLKEYLKPELIKDIAINGIQVENEGEIKKIAFSVDLSEELITKVLSNKCNLIIVHHGIFWGTPFPICGSIRKRIKLLLENNIGVIAYHLPLDMHPEIGNNAQILKKITNNTLLPFGFDKGIYYGYQVEVENTSIEKIKKLLGLKNEDGIYLNFGKNEIKKIAVISGSGAKFLNEAIESKVDLFITGETEHSIYHLAKEEKINILFAGHYYTETFGVKALMKLIKEKFNLETEFFDIPTGL